MENHSLVWLRRDLRISDNTALSKALEQSNQISLAFIFDTHITRSLPKNDRRITFIWESLQDINIQLADKGVRPVSIFFGKPEEVIPHILRRNSLSALYFNTDYEPYALKRDTAVHEFCGKNGIRCFSFKDQVMFGASDILKVDGTPYRVFTAYKNKWLSEFGAAAPPAVNKIRLDPKKIIPLKKRSKQLTSLAQMGFEAQKNILAGGEMEALKRWKVFKVHALSVYSETRNHPGINGTAQLSPYLRFGNIPVRRLMRYVRSQRSRGAQMFLSELIWREFFMMILHYFPHVVSESFNAQYDGVAWINGRKFFKAWCEGRTGFPIVDAGMRELNATGLMHNRVRMIAASFLVKHLHVDWRWGEKYFAEKLLDFELSSNNGNWQWAAGTGVDAAPYFRIFNPLTQSRKFDREGVYIKKWIPELRDVKPKQIHCPPDRSSYPAPIIDLNIERKVCLQLYGAIKKPR